LYYVREVRAMSDPAVSSPPLVPEGFDIDVYVVLEDYGKIGRAYREVDEERRATARR